MLKYLKKHSDKVRVSESVTSAQPSESEFRLKRMEMTNGILQSDHQRESLKQWGQQTLKLNILEPRLPFMSGNRKQLERILSDSK